jgi:hypothetical protein
MICNSIYAGIPPYQQIVSDRMWVSSAIKAIEEQGAAQFLVNMLTVLRTSMAAALDSMEQ